MRPSLRTHAEQYLAIRRSMGFRSTNLGRDLLHFSAYLEAHQAKVITTDQAMA